MYFDDETGTSRYTLQDFEPSFNAKLSGAIRESWLESYGPVAVDYFSSIGGDAQKLGRDESAQYAESLGGFFKPDGEYTKNQLDVLSGRQRELTGIKDVRDRTPWDWGTPIRGVAMFAAGIADPVNLVAAFVPWTRFVSASRGLNAAAQSTAATTRIGARSALGAADAAISTAALELPYALARQELGDDYDAVDSVANIAFGAAFGGGVHVVGGVGVEAYKRFGPPSRNQAVDMPAIERGFESPEAQPVSAQRMAEMPENARQSVARAVVQADTEGRLAQAWEAAGRTEQFTDANIQAALESVPDLAMRIEPIPLTEIRNLEDVRQDSITAETGTAGVPDESPIMVTRTEDGGFSAITSSDQIKQALANGAETVQAVDIGLILERDAAELFEPRPVTAASKIQQAEPVQREAMLRTAVAQSLQGQAVEVDPILSGVDGAEMQSKMEKSLAPENSRTADFEQSRMIDEENASAPKWQALQDAEAAMVEADAILADAVKVADTAFKRSKARQSDSIIDPERQQEYNDYLAGGGEKSPYYARGITGQSAVDTLTTAVRQSFGQSTDALLARGQIQIVATPKDIPNGPHPGDVKASAATDGTVYVVAENMSEAEARGIVLHEVGVHVGMREMVGDEVFSDILAQLDAAILRGDDWAQRARAAVPEDTMAAHVREEQLAYLVQNSPELPIVQRLIAAVRAWVFRTFSVARERMQLTESDFKAMATAALHDVAKRGTFDRTAQDIRYSRGETPDTSTVADELKPFDENLARAKKVATALRAAADKLENNAQAVAAMKAAFPDISNDEAESLLADLRKQVSGMREAVRTMRTAVSAEDVAGQMQSQAMKAADTMANNIEMAAVIERRNAALNLAARTKAQTFLQQFNKPGLDVEGFFALLVGSQRLRVGSRMSIDAETKAFSNEWRGALLADLEKGGLTQLAAKGTFDREIYEAMYLIGKDQDLTGLPREAVEMAKIFSKYQESARNTRNRFGAWIRDLNGYITRQAHDMMKIRDAGERAWIDYVLPRLDIKKMRSLNLIGENVDESLRSLYDDFAAGAHHKTKASEEDLVAFGVGRNLAKRESVSRTLYFIDGLTAYEYNSKFGSGRLIESVVSGLESSARSSALLKTLGTNPEATLTRLMDDYENSLTGDPARRAAFRGKRQAILNRLAEVDGSTRIPGNVRAAKIGSFLRSWQTMAKLGGSLISSVTDLAGYAAEVRYGQGKNLLEGSLDGVLALVKKTEGKRRDILTSLGVFHESTLGGVMSRFDSPELVGGKMSAAMNTYFKFNGLSWWTESLRDGYALSYSNYMAGSRAVEFDALPDELKRMFELYRVDAGKWDIIRRSVVLDEEGRSYVSPDGLSTVPRGLFESYIKGVGRTVNDASLQSLQDDIAQTIRTMFIDRAHHAVLEPNARVRSFMNQGTKPGTMAGELLRYVGQFKSFSVAMIQMVLGREVYGRGYDTIGDYLKNGRGDMLGLVTYMALATGMGYAAMSIKDLLKGKNPRDPRDHKTVFAAMAQGGGAGLYGDFLFGEYNRMGRTLTSSLAGPVLGQADTIADLWTRIRNGDDTAAVSFKAAIDNTPFANLFYARVAADYLFLYGIHEAMNPGFLRRMEKRVQNQNNQEFLFPPSQYATQF